MAQQQISVISYSKECLRLFYWAYFKPFTLKQWLGMLPERQRLANQVRWLVTVVPLLIVSPISIFYTLFSSEPFYWLEWGLFVSCFVAGIWLPVLIRKKLWLFVLLGIMTVLIGFLSKDDTLFLVTFVSLLLGLFVCALIINITLFSQDDIALIWGLVWGSVWVLIWGLGWVWGWGSVSGCGLVWGSGLVWGWGLGSGSGLALGWILGWILGWVLGWVLGQGWKWEWVLGLALVLGWGWGWGWKWAWKLGFGWILGLVFILGSLRIYSWIFECLWACILYGLSRRGSPASWLRYLPYRTDEVIILPLPFMVALIVEAYQDNYALAQQAIQYLASSTNQRRVVAQAIVHITLNLLSRCQTIVEIASVAERLDWIPSLAPKKLGTLLPQLLEVGSTRSNDGKYPCSSGISAERSNKNSRQTTRWLVIHFRAAGGHNIWSDCAVLAKHTSDGTVSY